MTGPPRRRRRPAVSCIPCRKRKVRCNRGMPCSNCTRARNATCAYDAIPPPSAPRRRMAELAPSSQSSHKYPSPASTADSGVIPAPSVGNPVGAAPQASNRPSPAGQPSLSEYQAMKSRIAQLEERLSLATPTLKEPSSLTLENSFVGTFHVRHRGQVPGRVAVASQSITHKGRVFGQSHWLNSFIPIRDLFETMELNLRDEKAAALLSIERCKYLARAIKDRRAPLWPAPPTTDLPAKDVCDRLIDSYLHTTESVYRVLHLPSFRQEYESLWQSSAAPAPGFLVQLKLVLAIGAAAHDDTYALRRVSVRWIYEAQTHLAEPEFKPRLTARSLQTHILLLFARQTANIGGSLVWISAGELLRTAMFMGLNQDPCGAGRPSVSGLACEMQRRLWNTVLEIAVQTSMDSGGPPLISMADFDTLPPQNIPDEKLLEENAVPAADEEYTETSIARTLRSTLPARLAIAKHLNDPGAEGTYDEALKLDRALRASHKFMTRALEALRCSTNPAPFDTGARLASFIVVSYTSALHTPFLTAAYQDPAYAYSRLTLLQNSLRLWPAIYPASALSARADHDPSPASDVWRRLVNCQYRIFHVAIKQASVTIVLELKAQVQDGDGVGAGLPFRGDLLAMLREMRDWSLENVRTGETNVKGYIAARLAVAYAEGVCRTLSDEEMSNSLVQAAGDAADVCLPLLEAELGHEGEGEEFDGAWGELPSHSEGLDWGDIFPFCQASEYQAGFGAWDAIGWVLDEETLGVGMDW